MAGVPKGYRHNWTYRGRWKERKLRPGLWKIDFRATKRTRSGRGGPRRGSKIVWGIRAKQYAVKTGRGTYQTRLIGTKRVIRHRMKHGRRHKKY